MDNNKHGILTNIFSRKSTKPTMSHRIIDNKLLLSKNSVQGMIPELNGYAPIEAKLLEGGGNFSYDGETRKFTIIKAAVFHQLYLVLINGLQCVVREINILQWLRIVIRWLI